MTYYAIVFTIDGSEFNVYSHEEIDANEMITSKAVVTFDGWWDETEDGQAFGDTAVTINFKHVVAVVEVAL